MYNSKFSTSEVAFKYARKNIRSNRISTKVHVVFLSKILRLICLGSTPPKTLVKNYFCQEHLMMFHR